MQNEEDVNVHEHDFVNYDWEGEQRREYVPPEGTVLLEAVEVERNTSQEGNPQLKVKWEIVGDGNGGKSKFDGRFVTSWYSEVGEQKSLKRFLRIIDVLTPKGYSPSKVRGKRILADLKVNVVDRFNALTGENEQKKYSNVWNERLP